MARKLIDMFNATITTRAVDDCCEFMDAEQLFYGDCEPSTD